MPSIPIDVPERSAWRTQSSVVWALYVREIRTRFGKYRLGLVWALIEPSAMIFLKAAIFGFVLQVTIPSIPYLIFLAAGFIPFRFFTALLTRSANAITANQGLLVYRQVRPIDPFLARLLQESLVFVLVSAMFLIVAVFMGTPPRIGHPMMILISLASLVMIATGLGIFLGVLTHSHGELEKIIPLISQPLLFISCVLFPLSRVPSNYEHLFLWNPLVVIFEGFRKGLYPNYPTADLPLLYPFCVGIICLWLGIAYYWKKIDILYLPGQN